MSATHHIPFRLRRQFDVRATSYRAVYSDSATSNLWHHEKRRRVEWTVEWISASARADKPLRILDAGCGNGALACRLAELPCVANVTGIDISDRMVEEARRNSHLRNVACSTNFTRGEIESAGGSWDIIASLGVLGYQHDAITVARRMATLLAPDGYLIVTTGNPLSIPRWSRAIGGRVKRLFRNCGDVPFRPTSLTDLGAALAGEGCELVDHRSLSYGLGAWPSHRGVKASRRREDRSLAAGKRSRWWAQTDWTVWRRPIRG